MRVWNLMAMVLVVAVTLGGCGQKGPLYREDPEASSSPAGQASRTETRSERPEESRADAE